MLHVGASRHDGATCFFGLLDQRRGKPEQHLGDDAALSAQPHANQGGDLVVPRTAGAQFAAKFVACDFQQTALQCGGLVLVILDRGKGTGVDTTLQLVKGILHALQFVGRQQTGTAEGTGMGTRSRNVVIGQTPIELRGLAQSSQFRRWAGCETASPQCKMLSIVFSHSYIPYT